MGKFPSSEVTPGLWAPGDSPTWLHHAVTNGALATPRRAAVEVPLLRKEFILEEYQLWESRAAGADAVLLIVAALEDARLRDLHDAAKGIGLATLVEVHTAPELDRALALGAPIIGVNNRNLRTLQVDVHASEELIARMPEEVIAISESGLRTSEDLERLR